MHSGKEVKFDNLSVLLLDVAGTTTSLDYIKNKLFAFILEESPTFLKENFEVDGVRNALKELQADKEIDIDSSVETIKKLTSENSNDANFKFLQGLISKAGYEKGTLKAHIFSDVKTAMEIWSKDKTVAIYSSGDIEAQKLLFSNTTEGDLVPHITKFFDQSVGIKTASKSYSKIAEELKVKCDEIVFVSDDADELTAAKEAGLATAIIKREGNKDVSEEISKQFTFAITSLTELPAECSNKRKVDDFLDGSETPPSKLPRKDEILAKEEVELKTEEKVSTEKGCDNEKKTAEKETEAMEVDSTIEIKKNDEQNVPGNVETSMETETNKAVSVASEKTENEKPEQPVESSNSDETEIETETKQDTNTATSLDKNIEKVNETNVTEKKDLLDNVSTSEPLLESAELVNNGDKKDIDVVDKVSSAGVNANVLNKECNEIEEMTKTAESLKSAEKTELSDNSKEECLDKKLEESKDRLDKISEEASNENTKDATEEKNDELNGAKDEINVTKEVTEVTEKKGAVESESVTEEIKNDGVVAEKCSKDAKSVEEKSPEESVLNTQENGGNSESQNGKIISDVSNGVMNGQDGCDANSNGQKAEATDIKVKKTETSVDSPTVAVEV